MPNWCYNHLIVRGKGALEFLEANSSVYEDDGSKKYLDFSKSVPLPEEDSSVVAFLEMWGAGALYNTVVTTSRGNDEALAGALQKEEEEWVSYSFETVWLPPIPWARAVGQKFPHVSIDFFFAESIINNFRGRLKLVGGKTVTESTYEYYREYVTDEDLEQMISANPELKEWNGLPSSVNDFMKGLYFQDVFGDIMDDDDLEVRHKLIRTGEPYEEYLRGFTYHWLMEKARSNARDIFACNAFALLVLLRIQKAFKERYYALDGAFQAMAAKRFDINIKKWSSVVGTTSKRDQLSNSDEPSGRPA